MNEETKPPTHAEPDLLQPVDNSEAEAKTLDRLNYAYGFIGGCAWDLDPKLIECLDRVFELLRLDARNAKLEASRERDAGPGEAA